MKDKFGRKICIGQTVDVTINDETFTGEIIEIKGPWHALVSYEEDGVTDLAELCTSDEIVIYVDEHSLFEL